MIVNISAKLFQNPSSNNKVTPDTKNIPYFRPLTSECDLDIGARDLGLARHTLSHDGKYFCEIFSKSIKEMKVMDRI